MSHQNLPVQKGGLEFGIVGQVCVLRGGSNSDLICSGKEKPCVVKYAKKKPLKGAPRQGEELVVGMNEHDKEPVVGMKEHGEEPVVGMNEHDEEPVVGRKEHGEEPVVGMNKHELSVRVGEREEPVRCEGSEVNIPEQDPAENSEDKESLLRRSSKYRGLIATLLATLSFAFEVLFVKLLKGSVNSNEVACFRFCMQGMLCLPLVIYGGVSLKPTSLHECKLHILRTVFGASSLLCEFYALHHMPAADAIAIVFGAPVFVGIFGRIFLKESFGIVSFVKVISTVVGTILIANPPFLFGSHKEEDQSEFVSAMVAFFAAITAALTYIVVRALGVLKVSHYKTVFYYAIGASTLSAVTITCLGLWSVPECGYVRCGYVRYLMVGVGVFNVMGQCLLTYAFSLNSAVFVSIVRANQVIMVLLLEVLFLGVVPEWLSGIGTALILVSLVAASGKQWLKSRSRVG